MQVISTLEELKKLNEELDRITAKFKHKPKNLDWETWLQVCRNLQGMRSSLYSALLILNSQNGKPPDGLVRTYEF